MTLQDIFNSVVMNDEPMAVPCASRRAYESLRVALLRKFATHRAKSQRLGIASYDDKFICASYNEQKASASFVMLWKEESKRVKPAYAALKL